jgi:DNA uptake protein ComE-like DNA-binding protein
MSDVASRRTQAPGRAQHPDRTTAGVATVILLLNLANLSAMPAADAPSAARPELIRLRLDPNFATRDELMLLPGIGPKLSENIIEYRRAAHATPAFSVPEDLDNVPRIGPVTLERLRPYLRFRAGDGVQPQETRP